MKNSKLRRILLLVACAVLLVSLSVGATLAYLTSTTQTVKNTFTVGNVAITLDETNTDGVDQEGKANANVKRDNGNKYNILPAGSYVKDPTVHVDPKSEDCYVRMIVTVEGYEYLDDAFSAAYFSAENGFMLHEVVAGWDAGVWEFEKFNSSNNSYEFRYFAVVPKGTTDLAPLFTSIEIPANLNNTQIAHLENVKINVVAHAIQALGFKDADEAWEAFDVQNAAK